MASTPSKSLIVGPVDKLCGNPSDHGKQGKAVIPAHPRSKNSGVPEKQFDSEVPAKTKSFNPHKDLFMTPVKDE
jgi:hypothetical protein